MMRLKTASLSPYFVVVDFGNFAENTAAPSSKQRICTLNTQLHFDLCYRPNLKCEPFQFFVSMK